MHENDDASGSRHFDYIPKVRQAIVNVRINVGHDDVVRFRKTGKFLFSLIDLVIASKLFKVMLYKARVDATLDVD